MSGSCRVGTSALYKKGAAEVDKVEEGKAVKGGTYRVQGRQERPGR